MKQKRIIIERNANQKSKGKEQSTQQDDND